MANEDQRAEAVRVYRRTLDEVAENQVVAAAEDILTDAWIGELEQVRGETLACTDTLHEADESARELVRRAQRSGDLAELADAQARLSEVTAMREADIEVARLLVEAVDAELEHVCHVAVERSRRGRDDMSRLHAAWSEAYGG